ncbi:P-loop containing nucleoside triphosphate hydrolase protein, partial [Chytriomyces sp. MP71]
VKLIAFKENSKTFNYSGHALADRYHSHVGEDDATVGQFLLDALSLAQKFKLDPLINMPMLRLSNGQLMRTRLAKALVFSDAARAKFLILDEPFMGLDVATRSDLATILGEIARDPHAPNLMLLLRSQDTLPDWISHVLELNHMDVTFQGTMQEYTSRRHRTQEESVNQKRVNRQTPQTGKSLAALKSVTVQAVDGVKVLDQIDWTIKEGERWGLTGANGSGKTTLLSILVGDHPQAYSNDVNLFGHQRGTPGVTIWDIKAQIGFVSPEMHFHFTTKVQSGLIKGPSVVSLFDAVATGFNGGDRACTPATEFQSGLINNLLHDFKLWEHRDEPFLSLSTGTQRMALILRALVSERPLLIFDEPFQGVDEDGVAQVHAWLEKHLRPEQALVLVSHHSEEMPSVVNKRLELNGGKIVRCE